MNQHNYIPIAAIAELAHLVRSLVDDYRTRRARARFLARLEEWRRDSESQRRVQEIRGKVNPYAY